MTMILLHILVLLSLGTPAYFTPSSKVVALPQTYPEGQNGLFISCTSATFKPTISPYEAINCTMSMADDQPGAQLVSLVILKCHHGTHVYQELAVINALSPDSVLSLHNAEATMNGHINTTGESFLAMEWNHPGVSVSGHYICEANTLSNRGRTRVETVGTSLLSDESVESVYEAVASIQGELQVIMERQDALLGQLEALTRAENDQRDVVNALAQTVKSDCCASKMDPQLELLSLAASQAWPEGTYGLIATAKDGCPKSVFTKWYEGTGKHHTESDDRNHDTVSSPNHFIQPVKTVASGHHFMTQHFCMKLASFGAPWPAGSYCIHKRGPCPAGFSSGSVRWDEEYPFKGGSSGEIPEKSYGDWTTLWFCCRSDGAASKPIALPTTSSFYLFRHGGVCQQVAGMSVAGESILFDTDNEENDDTFAGAHPDGKASHDVKLEYCYYS